MARKRHTPEQIIRMLREVEVELAKGRSATDVIRKLRLGKLLSPARRRQARNRSLSTVPCKVHRRGRNMDLITP